MAEPVPIEVPSCRLPQPHAPLVKLLDPQGGSVPGRFQQVVDRVGRAIPPEIRPTEPKYKPRGVSFRL